MLKMQTQFGDMTLNDDNSVVVNKQLKDEIENNLVENDNEQKPNLNLKIED